MEQVWKNRENLNKNEIAKLEKDGLAIIDELPQLAKKSFEDIAWDDVERLKWAGIYAQRPKNGLFFDSN
jgi:ferredoxin-nitrite reductase